jgi:two-component system, OmpR family, sensor kinase
VTAVTALGWLLAFGAALRAVALRRRLELVAYAEHELRGPLAALTLAAEAARTRSRGIAAAVVEEQLSRASAGLGDLVAARRGRRAPARASRHDVGTLVERAARAWSATGADVRLDWRAGDAAAHLDPERLSQALGNLLANGVEHGRGAVAVRGIRVGELLRIELRNSGGRSRRRRPRPSFGRQRDGRGRGLTIAARAVREAGGTLRIASGEEGTAAAIELPLAEP